MEIPYKKPYIKIERKIITIKNLPSSFEKIKIVHLSDLHSLGFGSRERKVLEILAKLKPDFVFITGDFIDIITKITDRNLNSVKIFWQKLAEKNKIFAVLGTHDTQGVKRYLKESGITVLDNENRRLTFNNDYIYLIGVDAPCRGRDNLERALQGVKRDRTNILLAHGPEIIDEAVAKNIDLVLVGHTHGTQIKLPFLEGLVKLFLPLSKYGRRYTRGLFRIESTYLYVNQGIGTSFFPIRFNCPPEITLIELCYLKDCDTGQYIKQ